MAHDFPGKNFVFNYSGLIFFPVCKLPPFLHPSATDQEIVNTFIFHNYAFIVFQSVIGINIVFASFCLIFGKILVGVTKLCSKMESLKLSAIENFGFI
jgi:hypothetical protein